jgi:hypothetical protein
MRADQRSHTKVYEIQEDDNIVFNTFLGQSGKIHQKQSFRIWLTK